MHLNRQTCERARRTRDSRFDGRFFIGVVTTGIYCRPVCPAPPPKEQNVRYFTSAAAAAEEGFRPCLRCRPETSPGTPAWLGTSVTVSRALRLIAESALSDSTIEDLAARLGIGSRHLRRLFLEHVGATPVAVLQTARVHFAKKLIDETALPFTEIAMAAGFGSVRRFNACFQGLYGRTPTEIRALAQRHSEPTSGEYVLHLRFRPPFDWSGILGFLRPRAIPGVEQVDAGSYSRSISLDAKQGSFEARLHGDSIAIRVQFPDPRALFRINERIRRLFDLTADPYEISRHLGAGGMLAPFVKKRPGLRVPGAWDGFELTVRAILGQQVTVKGATTLAGRLVAEYGTPFTGRGGLTHIFPGPGVIAAADLTRIGLPGARAESIRAVARLVAAGDIDFGSVADPAIVLEKLRGVPGIGDWTVQYIAMRALNEPDAFPASDLGLLRAAGLKNPKELAQHAESWRPWRAYAAMHLWQGESNADNVLHSHRDTNRAATAGRE